MNSFNAALVRAASWRSVEATGLRTNESLPLLEPSRRPRSVEELADRLLCMATVASHAFGLPLATCQEWLDQERLRTRLSASERDFVSGAQDQKLAIQMQVHSSYALAWSLSVVDDFSVNRKMPTDFVHRLPDIRNLEPSATFRSRLVLRSIADLLTQLDAAYCFHWAWRDAYLSMDHSRPVNNLLMVGERRKALEWIFLDGNWDEVLLDT